MTDKMIDLTLIIGGMNCGGCAGTVEGALSQVPGIVSASVDLATARANVTFIAGEADLDTIRAAVAQISYEVIGVDDTPAVVD